MILRGLLFVILASLLFTSCMRDEEERTYEITYSDGTTEVVTVEGELKFDGTNGCIKLITCGCGGSSNDAFRCDVRTFDIY